MSDDTTDVAVETESTEPSYVTKDDLDKFSDKLTSHFGRIVAKQFEEKYLPQIKENQLDPEKLNEQLNNKLFGGDVYGTVRDVIAKIREEENTVRTEKEKAIAKEMEKFEAEPLFAETRADVEKLAKEALANGYPPGPAVELAVSKAKTNFLLNKDPEYNLGMSGSGKPPKRTKQPKLPSELKAAAERDIADGLFKDEAEYIAELSPSIRDKYGI